MVKEGKEKAIIKFFLKEQMTQEKLSLKGIPGQPNKDGGEPKGAHQGTDHQDQVPWEKRKDENNAQCPHNKF